LIDVLNKSSNLEFIKANSKYTSLKIFLMWLKTSWQN